MKDKYLKKLDFVRLFACIAILFYHLGILKGGYLAVCTFFVLTGYLTVKSISNKENFSIKEYYISRIKKIYIPLLIIVFTTITIMSLLNINDINLKQEVTSILLGYNNYWQLNANLDYFVRHISSPFVHLWYIAIILQFEFIFPILYLGWKKIKFKNQMNKILSITCCIFFGIISYIIFYSEVKKGNLMSAYYGTIPRLFSILFGMALGIIRVNHKPVLSKYHNRIFNIDIILLAILFILIDFKSQLFAISMFLTTLISLRLMDYSIPQNNKRNKQEKMIHSLSSISYEIYLIQYPIIYILQDFKMNSFFKIIITILGTILFSYILHYALDWKKGRKGKEYKKMILTLFILISIFGLWKYITVKDYTKDIKKLEQELNNNTELIKQKQKEYAERRKNEEDQYQKELEELTNNQEELKEYVRNLKVTGIGDSIMELCIKELYEEFPNGYFDAEVNRTEKSAKGILQDLIKKNMLGDVVVINLGTNGNGLSTYRDEILETIGDRKIFWLNATQPDEEIYNPNLVEYASKHDNMYIIDWVKAVEGHPEYIIYDGVHPSVRGRKPYAEAIYNGIYKVYEEEIEKKKEQKIQEHESLENKKITFIGNDLLLGLYNDLIEDYNNADFIIDENFNYKKIKNQLELKIKDKSLNHNIVLILNNKIHLSKKEYNQLIELCKNYQIYIVDTNQLKIEKENVTLIPFKEKDYLSIDGVHITKKGYKVLKESIDSKLKK